MNNIEWRNILPGLQYASWSICIRSNRSVKNFEYLKNSVYINISFSVLEFRLQHLQIMMCIEIFLLFSKLKVKWIKKFIWRNRYVQVLNKLSGNYTKILKKCKILSIRVNFGISTIIFPNLNMGRIRFIILLAES